MSDSPPDLPTAGLVRRLLAMVYDGLLLLGVAFAYGVVVTLIRAGFLGMDELDYVNIPFVFHLLIWALLWAILAGYFVLCWTRRGQTLGMKSWRLQLETADGSPVAVKTAWLRTLLAPLSLAVAGLGYLRLLFDRSGGCWHDRWTGTRVVVQPREKHRVKQPDATTAAPRES